MTTLGYETTSPTALGTTNVALANCVTGPYVAGDNEMAIINMGLQAFSGGANHIMLAPMVSQNGGAAGFASGFYAIQDLGPNGYGSTQTMASMSLTPGVAYRFMTGARLLSAGGVGELVCRAVIVIAKRP